MIIKQRACDFHRPFVYGDFSLSLDIKKLPGKPGSFCFLSLFLSDLGWWREVAFASRECRNVKVFRCTTCLGFFNHHFVSAF